jgi:hypothetical protein
VIRGLRFLQERRVFTPCITCMGDKHYRYYVNALAIKIGADAFEVRRLPTGEIESGLFDQIPEALQPAQLAAKELLAPFPLD